MLFPDKGELSQLRSGSRVTAPEVVDGQLRYKVFVLGMRGSGKTVFLACMHHRLAVEHPENRFYVKLDDAKQENQLRETFEEIINPDLEWPPGTLAITNYEFKCRHTTPEGAKNLFRIAYDDYPGSALGGRTDLGDADITAIREGTEKAHAIIALIDGQKVLQSIEGRDVRDTLMSDLNILVARLMHGAEKPVTFLLTKYDILDGVHSLLRIRQELFKSDDFKAFVGLRRALGLPLHLIPISAVGSSFARFDPADGRMKKMVGGRSRPLNTEFALGCTVINQFKLFEEQRLERSFKAVVLRKLPPLLRFFTDEGWWEIPGLPFKLSPRRILGVLGGIQVAGMSFEDYLVELLKRVATDEKSAIELVFELMAARLSELRTREPATDLGLRLEP